MKPPSEITPQAALSPGFVHHDRRRVRQIQAAITGTHRNSQAPLRRTFFRAPLAAARAFPARRRTHRRLRTARCRSGDAARGDSEPTRTASAAMHSARLCQTCTFATAPRSPCRRGARAFSSMMSKPSGRDRGAAVAPAVRAHADHVAGVRRDLRLEQDDVKHRAVVEVDYRARCFAPEPNRSISAASSSTRRSCCCRAASASARSTRASRASRNRDVGAIVLKGTTLRSRGSATRRTASAETPMGMLNAHRPAESRRRATSSTTILPSLDFTRDALHRQRLRLDDRGVRRGHAPLRRFADRRDRRSTSPARTSRKAASQFGNYPRDVGARGRCLPRA